MDIGQKLAQLEKRMAAMERQSRLAHASLDDTSLEVRDGSGSLRALVGQQADGTTAVNVVNGGPPPTPSTPTVAPALGGIAVGWDGTFADGQIMPLDWSRIEVHASDTTGFTPTAETLQATVETPQGAIVYIPATAPMYVRLLARNTSGTASTATAEVGPYSPRPISDEIGPGGITETLIADGSITTPKVFANAITTPKLAVGSVDATALKADAITGKTITGGVINGAELHSDDGAGGLVDIEDGTVTATSPDGWKILVDPTQTYPAIGWLLPSGGVAAAINGNTQDTIPGLNLSSGPFTDGAVTDWRWTTYMGQQPGGTNNWRVRRVRESDTSIYLGGQIIAAPTLSSLSYIDSATPANNNFFEVFSTQAKLTGGRLQVAPAVSSQASVFVNAATGHTGMLFRGDVNSSPMFQVSPTGNVIATGDVSGASLTTTGTASAGELAVTGTTWLTYTPTVAGAGTATWATRDGWYFKIGKMVYLEVYIAFSAAGSGTGTVTVTLPSTPYRGPSSNRRQYLPTYCGGMLAGTNANVGGVAVGNINIGGSGAIIDQLRGPTDILYRGENFSNSATITINGWYREA